MITKYFQHAKLDFSHVNSIFVGFLGNLPFSITAQDFVHLQSGSKDGDLQTNREQNSATECKKGNFFLSTWDTTAYMNNMKKL